MLNFMEEERKKQISQEQIYHAEASEKPIENVYKPRSLIFERQPSRYAWFVLDSSDDLKNRDAVWKKTNKLKIAQNIYGTQRSGGVPVKTFKTSHNTNSLNKNTESNANVSETNITCAKQRTRKRSIQKTNDTGLRYRNKRIHLKEENFDTKVNPGQESSCQDKNEITKDEVTCNQKKAAEESLKLEDNMDHRKSPPFTETQNYLEHNDMTNTVTSAERSSEAHVGQLGAKSSDSSAKPTENKHEISKQDSVKLYISPEPAEMNNVFMNVVYATPLEENEKTIIPQSQCLETNKEKENRIFGRTPDTLSGVNTEAVKFSFGSSTTDNSYKEAIVFSARDRHRNQNEADTVKQNTLKLRKPEETTHRNVNDVKKFNDRVQGIGENMLNGSPSQRQKDDVQIKQNSGMEDFSQGIKPSRRDKYGLQRQNEITDELIIVNEHKEDSENQKISTDKDRMIFNLNPDTNAENTETICKTCLALQAAEKFNYKSFSVVIDTLTEVKQQSSTGDTSTEVKQKPSEDDLSNNEKQDIKNTASQKFSDVTASAKAEPHNFINTEPEMTVNKTASHEFSDEIVCGKPEPHHSANIDHEINDDLQIESCLSSPQKTELVATKTERLIDDLTVSSSTEKNVTIEHMESSAMPNTLPTQHASVQPKYSASSENSQILENESQPSAESLVTDKQPKGKKHRHGWFTRLFARLHKRKTKKVVECDIVSTPPKSCS